MSELNVYHHELRHNEYDEFYLKYEADKVIAELKDDVTCWKKVAKKNMDDNVAMARERAKAFESECHQKYKRCLAMAMWCETQFAYYIASCDRYDNKYVNKKAGHFYKWKYKWLELAEKFKEANNV